MKTFFSVVLAVIVLTGFSLSHSEETTTSPLRPCRIETDNWVTVRGAMGLYFCGVFLKLDAPREILNWKEKVPVRIVVVSIPIRSEENKELTDLEYREGRIFIEGENDIRIFIPPNILVLQACPALEKGLKATKVSKDRIKKISERGGILAKDEKIELVSLACQYDCSKWESVLNPPLKKGDRR